jgi:hypothetical protein
MQNKHEPVNNKSINPVDVPTLRTDAALPEKLIGIVIDFEKTGKKLNMDIMLIKNFDLRPGVNYKNDLDSAIKYIIEGKITKKGTKNKKKMRLAVRNPIYLAVRLSDKTDWQFMEEFVPFQLPGSGNIGQFFDAEKYKIDSNGLPVVVTREPGVRLALMKYYPPNPVPSYDFGDRFNINTECFMDDHEGFSQKIPIIFDPEVGWPQGTKP